VRDNHAIILSCDIAPLYLLVSSDLLSSSRLGITARMTIALLRIVSNRLSTDCEVAMISLHGRGSSKSLSIALVAVMFILSICSMMIILKSPKGALVNRSIISLDHRSITGHRFSVSTI